MKLILTNDKNARNIIAECSKSSADIAGQNTYYMGKDKRTGKKRYLVKEDKIELIKSKLNDCEIWEI